MREIREQTAEIRVIHEGERAWADLVNPPGALGTSGMDMTEHHQGTMMPQTVIAF